MKESETQKQVCNYLKSRNIFHFRAPNITIRNRTNILTKGVPDLIAVIGGVFIGLEIKTTKGIQSKEQKEFEINIKNAGGKYYLIRSLNDIIKITKA